MTASQSIHMEGFVVLPEYKALCERLLSKEITMSEYIAAVKAMQGINAYSIDSISADC